MATHEVCIQDSDIEQLKKFYHELDKKVGIIESRQNSLENDVSEIKENIIRIFDRMEKLAESIKDTDKKRDIFSISTLVTIVITAAFYIFSTFS